MVTREALKEIIVKKKDEGMTFSQISEYLKDEYDIDRTRQSVYGMYKRAKTIKPDPISKLDTGLVVDILHLYVLGYSTYRIQEELDTTVYRVKQVLENKDIDITMQIVRIRGEMIQRAFNMLMNNEDIPDIREELAYKQYPITDKGLRVIISEAVVMLLNKQTTSTLSKLADLGVSKDTVRRSVGLFKERYTVNASIGQDS